MKAAEARNVLLLRAFESPVSAPWSDADSQWANREARQMEGSRITPERFIIRRAWLGARWLRKRDPAISTALNVTRLAWWLGPLVVVLAFALGATVNAIGIDRRLNILAPPMLGLIAWNLVVFAVLLAGGLWRRGRRDRTGDARSPLMRWLVRVPQSVARVSNPSSMRFMADWGVHGREMHAQRAAAILHAAAAALALGAVAALYVRGLAFEYLAGWESTFLSADSVVALVHAVLGPASLITRLPLPGIAQMPELRFSDGGGVNAAQFIHLWAVTLALVVIVPRLVLGIVAVRRARRLANDFPLTLDDAYFQRVGRMATGQHLPLRIVPYAATLDTQALGGLRAWCERAVGQPVDLSTAARVEPGDEDDATVLRSALHPLTSAGTLVLFSATATPERETHGLLLRELSAQRPERIAVIVDESAFRARFTGAGADARRDERRAAWRALLAEERLVPVFTELSAVGNNSTDPAATEALAEVLATISR